MNPIQTIIFDLGGVLIDWNPRYLYRQLLPDEDAVSHFLEHIATGDWNEEQDAGRTLAEGTELLVAQHFGPAAIECADERLVLWVLGGPIPGTVDLFRRLKAAGWPLYALTNWSAETWPVALERYDFLGWFDGVLVSGAERMRKPNPAFYQLLEQRFSIELATSLFIDDNLRNVEAARALGMRSIHFESPEQLGEALGNLAGIDSAF